MNALSVKPFGNFTQEFTVKMCYDWQMSPTVEKFDYMLLKRVKPCELLVNGVYCFCIGGSYAIRRIKSITENSFLGYGDGSKIEQNFFFDNIKELYFVVKTVRKQTNPHHGFCFYGE